MRYTAAHNVLRVTQSHLNDGVNLLNSFSVYIESSSW